MNDLQVKRTDKIKKLLGELDGMMKMTVSKAIEIGELLIQQRDELEHGEFVRWLNENFALDDNTAYRYMKLAKYQNKIPTKGNLQEAYKQIDYIESQEKQKEQKRVEKLIHKRRETGEKPDGWDRKCDHQWQKWGDDQAFKERLEKTFEKKEPEKKFSTLEEDLEFERKLKESIDQSKAEKDIRDKLRLARKGDNLSQNIIFDTIDDYVNQGENNHEMIERANNIIKYVRDITVKLQKGTIAS